MQLRSRDPHVAGAQGRAESEVDGQLVILAIDATILEHVRSPGPLDDGLWHFVRQRLALVDAKLFDDAEWTCFGKVESSPMSNEELDDAAATVYERI